MKKQVTFTIDPEILEELRIIGFEKRLSKSQLVEDALKTLINDYHLEGDALAQESREMELYK